MMSLGHCSLKEAEGARRGEDGGEEPASPVSLSGKHNTTDNQGGQRRKQKRRQHNAVEDGEYGRPFHQPTKAERMKIKKNKKAKHKGGVSGLEEQIVKQTTHEQ